MSALWVCLLRGTTFFVTFTKAWVNQRLEATCKAGHVRGKWMWLSSPRMEQQDEAMVPDFRCGLFHANISILFHTQMDSGFSYSTHKEIVCLSAFLGFILSLWTAPQLAYI